MDRGMVMVKAMMTTVNTIQPHIIVLKRKSMKLLMHWLKTSKHIRKNVFYLQQTSDRKSWQISRILSLLPKVYLLKNRFLLHPYGILNWKTESLTFKQLRAQLKLHWLLNAQQLPKESVLLVKKQQKQSRNFTYHSTKLAMEDIVVDTDMDMDMHKLLRSLGMLCLNMDMVTSMATVNRIQITILATTTSTKTMVVQRIIQKSTSITMSAITMVEMIMKLIMNTMVATVDTIIMKKTKSAKLKKKSRNILMTLMLLLSLKVQLGTLLLNRLKRVLKL